MCIACYHDEQGCFLDPNGKKSQNPGILSRGALKATKAQCWCPKFLTDPGEAADLILELGNSEMLMRGAVEALNSGDPRNTRRLIDQYIVKTPIDVRDADWLRALERRLGILIYANPITGEDFQDFTKLPAKLKEASIDPIETNPFPEGHIAHDI
jgi:hypothetical protein